jgi:hypothetical protein
VTTKPPEPPAQVPDRAVIAANAGARSKVLGWARRSIDLIPTSWLLTGAGAVILATTAVFGGLEAAAVDPTPVVKVGETFAGSDLEMTVVGVELRDELSAESGHTLVYPDEEKGERILVVTVDVTNTFDKPRPSTANAPLSPVVDGIRIEGLDKRATSSVPTTASAHPGCSPMSPPACCSPGPSGRTTSTTAMRSLSPSPIRTTTSGRA